MDYFEETIKTDAERELDKTVEVALYDLLEYLKKQDYEVLFLDTPHYLTTDEYEKMNTVKAVLDEYGFTYKVYDAEDGTFNLFAEFYNDGHVNYFGAERFTELFAQYLKENYDFPDRREDSRCAVWYGAYDAIKEKTASLSTYMKMTRPEVTVETAADGSISIHWDKQDIAKGYEIFRNTGEGGRYERVKKIKDSEVTEFTDTEAEAGTDYYYMVRAYRKVNGKTVYSRYSEVVKTNE